MPELNPLEKELLQKLQEGLSLQSRPFKCLAGELGISEEEVLQIIEKLKKKKIIRRVGGVWNTSRLGFDSTLVALKVEPVHIEEVASCISAYPGVTHNYEREHTFNLWFTLTAENKQKINSILREIFSFKGVEAMLELPAVQKFKVEVKFNWEGKGHAK